MAMTEVRAAPPVVRRMRPQDERHVRRIFRDTLLAGSPAPDHLGDLDDYERLCLDWYLDAGIVEVVEVDGRIRGYLLACLDEAAHRRWSRRAAARWTQRRAHAAMTGRLRGHARRFVVLRMLDAWEALRHGPPAPFPAHAHINLDRAARAGVVGRRLAERMDALVTEAGMGGWYAEMTVPQGRSLAAVERAGGVIVHRQDSRTLTWLLGRPVQRVTVARPVTRDGDVTGEVAG